MLDFMICALTNIFRIYLINRFVHVYVGKKEVKRIQILIVGLCFWITNTVLFWQFHMVWINVFSNLFGIGLIVFLYTKSVKEILFVTGSIYFLLAACDVVSTIPFIHYQDGVAHSQVFGVIAFFIMLICELISERIITIRRNIREAQNFALVFVPICSIVLITFLIYSSTCTGTGLVIVCVGLMAINFLMLYLYNLLLCSLTEKYEAQILRQQVKIYAHQLDVIRESETKIKTLRHDLKHHLNELKWMANKHNVTEIQNYIDRMDSYLQNPSEMFSSGNMEIDSVLNYMLSKAKTELKTVTAKVMLPEAIEHSFDINVLLGNLLENALEAAKSTEEKYLDLDITLKKGVLKIQVANSFLPENLKEERWGEKKVYRSTKKSNGLHGIGLQSVRRIVETYDGIMEITQKERVFCVSLVLYMS